MKCSFLPCLIFLLATLLFPLHLSAEEESNQPPGVPEIVMEGEREVITVLEQEDVKESISQLFYGGLKQYSEGAAGAASDLFQQVLERASAEAYINLSDFSLTLLSQARSSYNQGDQAGARFLINWAKKLSPEDGKVSFAKASLYQITGIGPAMSETLEGIASLPSRPSLVTAFTVNALTTGLIGLTLSLFIVAVLQLGKNAELLIMRVSQLLPVHYRGFFGPILTISVLVVPLWLGILPALAVWSVLLSLYFVPCRWFSALVGTLIVAWVVIIPVVERVGPQLEVSSNIALENVNNHNYSDRDRKVLEDSVNNNPSDLASQFIYAQILGREGKFLESEAKFRKIISGTSRKEALHTNSQINLAGVLFKQGRAEEARIIFDDLLKRGKDSFEVYYAYAKLKMSELDTEGHRQMYKKASDLDPEKLAWVEQYKVADSVPLFASMPVKGLFERYLKPSVQAATDPRGVLRKEIDLKSSLYSGLLRGGDMMVALILGLLTIVTGLFIRFRKQGKSETRVEHKPFFSDQKSLVWHGFPCGGLIAGRHPLLGAVLLGFICSLLICAIEKPVKLLPISDFLLGMSEVFICLAVALFLMTSIFTLLFSQEGRSMGEGENA